MKYIALLIALLALGGVLWGTVVAAQFLIAWANVIPKEMAVALVSAVGALFAAAIPIAVGRYFERVKEAEARLREKKTVMYELFLTRLFDVLFASKVDPERDVNKLAEDKEFIKFFMDFSSKIIIYGSGDLIKSYVAWRRGANTATPAQNLVNLETVLFQIRKELGNSNKGLVKGDLMQTFINDDVTPLIEEVDESSRVENINPQPALKLPSEANRENSELRIGVKRKSG